MNAVCYSCKKEIGFLKPRGTSTDIVRAGYDPPTGMSDTDKMCQECLSEIKKTQVKKKKDKKDVLKKDDDISFTWCLIITFIIPWALFYYAHRTKHLRIASIIIGIITAGSIIYLATPANSMTNNISSIFIIMGVVGFFGSHIFAPVIAGWWVLEWNDKIHSQSATSS